MSNNIAPLQVTPSHTSTGTLSYLPSFVAIFVSCASGAIRPGWWESHVTNSDIMILPNQCFTKCIQRIPGICGWYSVIATLNLFPSNGMKFCRK